MALRLVWLATALLLCTTTPTPAQDTEDLGGEVTIELSTGETLKGTLVAVDAITVVIQHPVLGELNVPRASILPPKADEVQAKSPWSGAFDLSVTGSSGNTKKQDARVAFNARRDTEVAIDSYELTYFRSQAEVRRDNPNPPPATDKDTEKTADRLYGMARREWRLADSRWRPFAQVSGERDEFKDWDYRTTVAVGAAHPIIEQERQQLTGRLGLAGTREFGGEDESWTPEALLAADYRLDVSKTQRLVAGVEVYPNLEDKGEYRSVSRAQYETQLDGEEPWTLKVGIEHFYDSDPEEGSGSGDLNYWIGLGYIF